jgi:Uma2 family endonuclease
MSAPNFAHQAIAGELYALLRNFLKGKECRAFIAPFDVRLPKVKGGSLEDKEVYTVLQPDVCVVCDKSKYDFKGCIGAPDIVVEILSPSNNEKELKNKFEIYEEAGVLEYWIISPQDNTLLQYKLVDDKFIATKPLISGDALTSAVLPGFSVDLKELFEVAKF